MTSNPSPIPNSERELDSIMEDLIVGHNFDYARTALIAWKDQAVAAARSNAPLNKHDLQQAFDKAFLAQAGHEDKGDPSKPATHCVWHRHDDLLQWFASYLETVVAAAEIVARKAEHQSWSIVYGIGYDPDNIELSKNITTLREKWSRDELEINALLQSHHQQTNQAAGGGKI